MLTEMNFLPKMQSTDLLASPALTPNLQSAEKPLEIWNGILLTWLIRSFSAIKGASPLRSRKAWLRHAAYPIPQTSILLMMLRMLAFFLWNAACWKQEFYLIMLAFHISCVCDQETTSQWSSSVRGGLNFSCFVGRKHKGGKYSTKTEAPCCSSSSFLQDQTVWKLAN